MAAPLNKCLTKLINYAEQTFNIQGEIHIMTLDYQEQQKNAVKSKINNRVMGISFDSIPVEIEIDENATPEEIKQKAKEYLLNNFWDLVEGRMECVIMPQGTLNEKSVFIGQLVKIIDTNKSGVVLKINKQNHKSVTVLFADETTNIYHYHDLKRTYESVDSSTFPVGKLEDANGINSNVIYRLQTENTSKLAIITVNNNLKSNRVGVHFITNTAKRCVKFMPYDEALNNIINC